VPGGIFGDRTIAPLDAADRHTNIMAAIHISFIYIPARIDQVSLDPIVSHAAEPSCLVRKILLLMDDASAAKSRNSPAARAD